VTLESNIKHEFVPASESTPTKPVITRHHIWEQVKRDIETKEVQTSPTYSYQWMADQAGHIAIGMLFVLLPWSLGELLQLQRVVTWAPWIGFGLLIGFAFLLEAWDYSQASKKIGPDPLFNATRDRSDLRQNAGIAVYYMGLGGVIALSALLSPAMFNKLSHSLLVLISLYVTMLIVLALLTVAPAIYWLRQKIRFQQVGLPYLFRLPEFKRDGFNRNIATEIDQFIDNSGKVSEKKHIAIVGPLNSGKTTLAVGIATESSFRNKKACYLTFDKLQQIVASNQEPKAPRNTRLWPWKHSQLLIVDDVTAGIPDSTAELPEQLEKELQVLGPKAIAAIKQRHTVWCLGADVSKLRQWTDVLMTGCGIAEKDLITVTLEELSEQSADRARGRVVSENS